MKKIISFFFFIFTILSLVVFCGCNEEDDLLNNNDNSSAGSEIDHPDTTTIITNAVSDINGNSYDAVRIGDQIWMASNLRTTHFANGEAISSGSEDHDIIYTEPRRYAPNNDESDVSSYGYLYNWAAVMHGAESSDENPSGVQGICPDGWHVPSNPEWYQLTHYLSLHREFWTIPDSPGNSSPSFAKALASKTGWIYSGGHGTVGNDSGTNNATGFSALPAGSCYDGVYYASYGEEAIFWSATLSLASESPSQRGAWIRKIRYCYSGVFIEEESIGKGLSVRCIKD